MELKRNESHPDRGYVQMVDDEARFRTKLEQNRTTPPTLLNPHHRPSYLPDPADYARHHENNNPAITATTTAAKTEQIHNGARSGVVSNFQGFTTQTETENDRIRGKCKIGRSKRSTLRSRQSVEESDAFSQVLKLR